VHNNLGRNAQNYTYGRAKIISGNVCINGRTWKKDVVCDYRAYVGGSARRSTLYVGMISDFVAVSYTHKHFERMRGRVRQSTLQGKLLFARLRQYHPRPVREDNMWVAPLKPAYRMLAAVIPVQDLCSYLHPAQERRRRFGYVNLITVAVSFVNA
jgi:hypothetical protein